jgi:exonuclease VII large subunit
LGEQGKKPNTKTGRLEAKEEELKAITNELEKWSKDTLAIEELKDQEDELDRLRGTIETQNQQLEKRDEQIAKAAANDKSQLASERLVELEEDLKQSRQREQCHRDLLEKTSVGDMVKSAITKNKGFGLVSLAGILDGMANGHSTGPLGVGSRRLPGSKRR